MKRWTADLILPNAHNRPSGAITCLLSAAILLLLMTATPAMADKVATALPGKHRSNVEKAISSVTATIQEKTRQSVTTSTGQRFALNSQTFIVGLEGKEVRLEQMKVPCETEIFFTTSKGGPTARRIVIQWVSPNATADLGSEVPH